MSLFLSSPANVTGVPLTLGLVGHPYDPSSVTYSLRDDPALSSYLQSVASSSLIEMASHSHQYLTYEEKSVHWIEGDLNSSKSENEFVTGGSLTVYLTAPRL